MEAKDVNLNEIHKLPESEFRKHFAQWVEEDGVARALQAKLRKDLIETFSRTHLGRRIYAMYSKANRMILSPQILALNTLVAEFLYAQHCHFSLSVFSTEVPYRNTLPDFESEPTFRFTKSDIKEIFEAISIDAPEEFQQLIIECYFDEPGPKGCMSLLYLILKNIFKFFVGCSSAPKRDAQTQPQKSGPSETSKDEGSDSESSKAKTGQSSERNSKKTAFTASYNNQFRYLNKYLVILSRKVKEMSHSLEQIEKRDVDTNRIQRKSLQARKMEHLNKSLEKISENLRLLSLSKRKNRKISVIISTVDRMAQQLEKCSENFQTMSRNFQEVQSTQPANNIGQAEKSYSEWVKELRSTKSGKKFVAKIEVALRKTLEEEKEKLAQAFDEKLENHKSLIKLKYKQKFLQRLESNAVPEKSNQPEKADEIRSFIERKLDELNKKHDELLKKIQENETHLKGNEIVINLETAKSQQRQPSPEAETAKSPEALEHETGSVPKSEKLPASSSETAIVVESEKPPQIEIPAQSQKPIDSHKPRQETKRQSNSVRRQLFQEVIQSDQQSEEDNETENIARLPRVLASKRRGHQTVDVRPQLIAIAKSIAEQERNIDHIIYGAKLRIQELEFESNKLDRGFQDYIGRQRVEKDPFEDNQANVLKNYYINKSLPNRKAARRRSRQKYAKTTDSNSDLSDSLSFEEFSSDETFKSNIRCKMPPPPSFEDPFHGLRDEILLKESWSNLDKPFAVEPNVNKNPKHIDTGTSSMIVEAQRPSLENKNTNRYLQVEVTSGRNETSASSDLNLGDATLEDIVLSDTKSSEKSHSSGKSGKSSDKNVSVQKSSGKSETLGNVSMTLKVPKVVLTRSIPSIGEVTSDHSDSGSNQMNFSTGKKGSSDDNFWD